MFRAQIARPAVHQAVVSRDLHREGILVANGDRAIRPRVELLLVAGLEVGEHCLDLIDFVERDVMSPTATDL